ncbi:hypothetical protein, partial [Klebsiella pneumoniae]|uniref:hypothetical protein n=1 Tax=Klebsiella pneumoniae TaxID=573 RepID=UPI001D0EEB6E
MKDNARLIPSPSIDISFSSLKPMSKYISLLLPIADIAISTILSSIFLKFSNISFFLFCVSRFDTFVIVASLFIFLDVVIIVAVLNL